MKKKSILLAVTVLLALCLWGCDRAAPVSSVTSAEPEPVAVQDPDHFAEGTRLGGKDISGKTLDQALTIAREAAAQAVNALEITVKFKNDTIALTKNDFTEKDVLDLTLAKLLASGAPGDYDLSYVTDLSDSGRRKLQEAAAACYVEGKDASVEGFDLSTGSFTFTDEQTGSRVDMVTTLKSVRQLLSQKHGGAIQATFEEVTPTATRKSLSESFALLSSYSTYSTNTANGNSNMALALSYVNGTVLQPGQLFSYNACIGDSTDPSRGWLPAGGYVGGVLSQVYGGGICQGSTTLYNAALEAGMEIVDRDCHSTPSSYCPIGLDATVDYGNIDFKFRNALENPVYIAAWMDGVTLTVNFYGVHPEDWDEIRVGSEMTSSTPRLTTVRFKESSKLQKGEYVRASEGYVGYTARAWRNYYKNDVLVRSEELPSSKYPASGPTFEVGPDTDTDKVDVTKESGTTLEPSPSPEPSVSPEPSESPAPGEEPTPAPNEPPVEPTPSEEPVIYDPTPPPAPEEPGQNEAPADPGVIDWSEPNG